MARLDVLEGHPEYEACDDGNTETGDGCRGDCSLIEVQPMSGQGSTSPAPPLVTGRRRCWGSRAADLKNWVAGQRSVRRRSCSTLRLLLFRENEQIDCYNGYQHSRVS